MKKLIVIFLSLCFLLNITGYQAIFYLRQQEIKAEMREAIRMQAYSEHETDFSFSVNDRHRMDQLDWEGKDEFCFNGEMYDVIEKKIENGKVIIRAIADQRETALLNKAKDQWNQSEKSNRAADELFQVLQSLFYASKTDEVVYIKPSKDKIFFISPQLPTRVKQIPTPPPRC